MDNYPVSFKVQSYGLDRYRGLSQSPQKEILRYFGDNKEEAESVLQSSNDKRFSPSTFIEENKGKFQVGWYNERREHCQTHHDIASAVTDYVLFSFGVGRLKFE